MKTIGFLFVVVLLTVGIAPVGLAKAVRYASPHGQQSEKEKIKKEDLPATAIKTLDSDAYKGWTLVQAYRSKVKDAQGKETSNFEYEVEIKRDNLVQVLKFDKDGNKR